MLTCPNCGRENPEGSAFCNACGAALTAEPAREVRKTVTVLFCDVAGSTAMGERLDPESLRRVMDRYFQAMRAPIERNGGTVEKFIGDAVMAVFGIPRVHEDDALRAVRAAAEMRRTLEDLNKELERDHAVSISNRIGVNTGEVVATDAASGDRLVTGDVVNTAARLEQAAGADETLLGDPTYRLVRDAVDAEAAPAIDAKGKAEPVRAWRLVAVREGVDGVVRRRDAPMVGRQGELRLLTEAFDRAVRERACVLVTILGQAGVGKSRLVDEFLGAVPDTTVLRGRCLPYGEGITFWPIVEMLTWAAGLSEVDPREDVLAKLRAVVEPSLDADTITQRLAHLLGLEGAQADPEETFWAVRKAFEAIASRAPLVVDLDDLHWAEPTLLDLVEHVADWSRGSPIVLLCSARPEFLDERSGWGGGKMNATSFLLEPLPEAETERLAQELLGDTGARRSLVERVAAASEGNPLFVEQMAAMITEDGMTGKDDPEAELAVPPTIQALLGARLDRLEPQERAVIERASIEGKVFHRGGVLALCNDELRASADQHLRSLVRRDLVRPAAPDVAGEDAFRFRHLLIRDAAYGSIPKETRADLHARFADWLERAGTERSELDEILAYHLDRSFTLRSELGPLDDVTLAVGRRAAELLSATGDRAAERGDTPSAAAMWQRAFELLPDAEPRGPALAAAAAQAFGEGGSFERKSEVLVSALERAQRSGSEGAIAGLAVIAATSGATLDPAANPAPRIIELAATCEAAIGAAHEHRRLLGWTRLAAGVAHNWLGRMTEAARLCEQAASDGEAVGDRFLERVARNRGFVVQVLGTRPISDLATDAESGHTFELKGVALALAGRIDEARAFGERALARARELGILSAAEPVFAGWTELLADRPDLAEPLLREGYARASAGFAASIAGYFARALHELGRDDEALEILAAHLDTPSDDYEAIGLERSAQAVILASRGELQEAERLAREGVAALEPTEDLIRHGETLLALATVLRAAGREEEAVTAARKALALFERKGDVPDARRTRSFLD
ncbi:MAG: adenylate/guanylate cyclase domain-containing protein [Actinomycetota bacterium]